MNRFEPPKSFKIAFDKTILWLLPYAYLISISYYWGYWGTFEIDAINYYPVTDLVKGVTSSIPGTLIFVAIYVFIMELFKPLLDYFLKLRALKTIILLCFILLIIMVIYYYKWHNKNVIINKLSITPIHYNESKILWFQLGILLTAIIATFIVNYKLFSNQFLFPKWWLLAIILLPCKAFSDGKGKALGIVNGSNFDYLIADSLATNHKDAYKYLGKTGDYHILSTLGGKKIIIVSTEKISPLIIQKFSIYDSVSVRRFNEYEKKLFKLYLEDIKKYSK